MVNYAQSVFFSGWKKSTFVPVKYRIGQKLKIYRIQNKFHVDCVHSVSIHSPIEIFRNFGRIDKIFQLNRHSLWICVLNLLAVFDSILRIPVAHSFWILVLLFTSTTLVPDSSVIIVHHKLKVISSVI